MSRHRGAKPRRRCELLGVISLLSPEYLLSVERWPFHQDHRITMTCFRTCSTCLSRSQAPLCHYTLYAWFPISLREPSRASVTFWEATAPVKLPTRHCPPTDYGCRLILRLARVVFQRWLHRDRSPVSSLPPILRKLTRESVSSCSKGSRGLSVLPRVKGIFTPSATSLRASPRQWEVVMPFVQVGTYPTRNFIP